jgi:hypothetical protein
MIGLYTLVMPRLEFMYLEEWVEHHFRVGVDKVFIYDNGHLSVDNSEWAVGSRELTDEEVGVKWRKKPDANYFLDRSDQEVEEAVYSLVGDRVDVVPWRLRHGHWTEYPKSQLTGFRHCVESNPEIDWWLFIDPDEFVLPRSFDVLPELIARMPSAGCFYFEQRVFQDRVSQPVRGIYEWGYDSDQSKALVAAPILDYQVHAPRPVSGEVVHVDRSDCIFHHYRGEPVNKGFNPKLNVGEVFFDKMDYSMRRYLGT